MRCTSCAVSIFALCASAAVGCKTLPPAHTTHGATGDRARRHPAHGSPSAKYDETIAQAQTGEPGAAGGPLSNAAPDSGESPLESTIEDASGHALAGFHRALARAARGEGQARIVFYGASHVASDLYTDVVRTQLQTRFGDAGTGFVLPAPSFQSYRNAGIQLDHGSGFLGVDVKVKTQLPDRYGLAGSYLHTHKKAATAGFLTRAHAGHSGDASRFELYYAKQPGGGTLVMSVDDKTRTLHTSAARFTTGYETLDVPEGPHHFELHAQGDGPTRVFGVSVERKTPGVVLDTLGIPGARVGYQLLWDDALYREQLARRKPDLVVLAYGTNEAGDDDFPMATYEANMQNVVARIREVAPEASCLLIGPSDRPIRNPDHTFSPRPRTQEVIDAQRRVAAADGCGFFDLVTFMGGPMSMVRWVDATPPLGAQDYIHFTRHGYEALGHTLHDALLAGYEDPTPSPATPTQPAPAAAERPDAPAPLSDAAPGSPQSP